MKLTKEQIDDMRTSLGHGAQPFTKEAIDTLCALAVRGLVAPEEAAWKSPKELPSVGQFCAVLTFDSEVGITDWRIANVRWDIGVKGWYPIPSPYVLEPQSNEGKT